jgi:hypothetical protein
MFSKRWYEINRRVDGLENQLSALALDQKKIADLERQVANFRLDYEGLYEKVRVNLAKLRKRALSDEDNGPPPDPLAEARKLLIRKKLEA